MPAGQIDALQNPDRAGGSRLGSSLHASPRGSGAPARGTGALRAPFSTRVVSPAPRRREDQALCRNTFLPVGCCLWPLSARGYAY